MNTIENADGTDMLAARRPDLPQKGLIVRDPWISALLEGRKTWELRGSSTKHRGRTGFIRSGTGRVFGESNLVGVVGPLDTDELVDAVDRHLVPLAVIRDGLSYAKVFAWVFEAAVRFEEPRRYRHPHGAVIWVDLAAHGER